MILLLFPLSFWARSFCGLKTKLYRNQKNTLAFSHRKSNIQNVNV